METITYLTELDIFVSSLQSRKELASTKSATARRSSHFGSINFGPRIGGVKTES